MHRARLIEDAISIWRAGTDAVRADRVVSQAVHWDGRWLCVNEERFDLRGIQRLLVLGAGKATYGMLCGLASALTSRPLRGLRIDGWINIPEGIADTDRISFGTQGDVMVCAARPKSVNEPTLRVVEGTKQILERLKLADATTCVIMLLSGGGSALLALPYPWVSLETKLAITRRLSGAGADIQALNEVRRCLSQVKGGGLAAASNAHRLISLVISDVLGDPLPMIASGPTLLEPAPDPRRALHVLDAYCPGEFPEIEYHLQHFSEARRPTATLVTHHILANNASAVDAAGIRAVELGYRYWMHAAKASEGAAATVGERLAEQLTHSSHSGLVDCIISGGEPTVVLPDPSIRGMGGRNQQLVLAAGKWLLEHTAPEREFAFLSGGTDGEDGPTDAAGAWVDSEWLDASRHRVAVIEDHLRRCDAYPLFQASDHLLRTGPTNTNVCDLRVAVLRRSTE